MRKKTVGEADQENWRRRKNCRTKTQNDKMTVKDRWERRSDQLIHTDGHVETWPCGADLKGSRQKSALRTSLKRWRNYRKSCLTCSLLGTFSAPPLFRSWTQSRRRKRLEGLRGAVPYFWIHMTVSLDCHHVSTTTGLVSDLTVQDSWLPVPTITHCVFI